MAKAGSTRGFLASVNAWTKATEERSEQAFQNTSLEFYNELSKATPVLTGNLRNSLVASVGGNQQMVTGPGRTSSDDSYRGGAEQSISNIMNAKIGDRISYLYLANYARRWNYGFTGYDSLGRFYNQAGRFWIQAVGARYRSIARRVAASLRMKMK